MRAFATSLLALLALMAMAQDVTVGSKKFTESYVLGEVAKKKLGDLGLEVQHKQGMGSTAIVWVALTGGDIDLYPEYTGTLAEEILKRPGIDLEGIRAELGKRGLGVTAELGFNNTYALVMKQERAAELGITKISDLATHPELRAGPTHEFLKRQDGWEKVMSSYGVKLENVSGIEHALGYAALNSGSIDIKDCYSTDAEIAKYGLGVLEDDKKFFPKYMAVFVYRLDLPPNAVDALKSMEGTIDEGLMSRLNARADETKDYSQGAALYFAERTGKKVEIQTQSLAAKLTPQILQHLLLVGTSLFLAVLIGLPLGIAASKPGVVSSAILHITGVIQTIPSLALLALLVPFLGIGSVTAVVALFLYSLLPIVRNTATGIATIPAPLRESAEALGLEAGDRLRKVYLPLALPTILAGIKTSAVINVGTATIAALIGAGGLGEPIISGININDNATILQGAIPAAILAIVVQLVFDLLERAVVPKGLRLGRH
jgi:osmoprotectant transport system permease protein